MTSVSLQPEDTPQTIRVLTFNILSADHANWERRRQAARSGRFGRFDPTSSRCKRQHPDKLAIRRPICWGRDTTSRSILRDPRTQSARRLPVGGHSLPCTSSI